MVYDSERTPTPLAVATPTPTPLADYPSKVYVENLGSNNVPDLEGEYTLQSSKKYFMALMGQYNYYLNTNGYQIAIKVSNSYHQVLTPSDSITNNIRTTNLKLFYEDNANWNNVLRVCRELGCGRTYSPTNSIRK